MNQAADAGDLLDRLGELILARRQADPDKSYVARLFAKGEDAMLKKVGEEATEFVLAAKGGERAQIVYEAADLWFHVLVALGAHGIAPREVLAELARREGVSGLQEFASRSAAARPSDTP
ncbi:phosphoribosyl-ATP diphosphatase [Thiomonas sp.]|jgi:phosphoribosyl-ATP pyrophosphohydrolase|uniref:phosphoribosyl-ATP diphosphatase n=1 Tax=Thiomonas sp. TaxID=2047785 RepID=UPI00260B796B|nr:phosphoribosyl-ATP diphosphatase [Thiomonas sp.]